MTEHCVESICDKLTHKYDRLFGPVFHSIIQNALSAAEAIILDFCKKNPDVLCDNRAILFSLGDSLLISFVELCSRSFIGLLIQSKTALIGQTSEERYQFFIQKILFPAWQEMSPEFELKKLVANRTEFMLSAVEEFFFRLSNDLIVIRNSLGISIHSIENIQFHAGDTHNNGRFVIIMVVNGEERLVYKPRSLGTDTLLGELMNWLNTNGSLRYQITHLRFVCRSNYGWQVFVSHKECESREEVERFMYRLGTLLFVSYLTGFSDLHHENLIAHGDTPIIIDTETMFGNNEYFGGQENRSVDSWNRAILHSVFISALLPVEILPGKVFERRKDSGLLSGLQKNDTVPVKRQVIVFAGTDEMSFSEETITPKREKWTNLPYLDGHPLHPGDCIELVADGFKDAYVTVQRKKEQFLSSMETGNLTNVKFRQIFRDTALYQKILLASYHPFYVNDRASRIKVFEKLHGKKNAICPEQTKLVLEEITQLLRDDIPYFFTTASSRALMAEDGCVIESFYQKSIMMLLKETVERLDDTDCYRQIFFIRCALDSEHYDITRNCYCPVDAAVFSDKSYSACLSSLSDWIITYRERFHRISSKGDFPLYIVRIPDKTKLVLRPEPATLCYGIGSFLFYDQYARIFSRRSDLGDNMLQAFLNPESPLVKQYHNNLRQCVGLFEGYGSYLYLYLYLYRFTHDSGYLALAEQLCDKLIALAPENDDCWGVIPGPAGIVIFALNAWGKRSDIVKLMQLAEECGKKLYEGYKSNKLPFQTGFAHGYAGFSTALIMLGSVTGNHAYYKAGMDLLNRESEQYDPSISGWKAAERNRDGMNAWCYGAPGILLARELARPYVRAEDLPVLEHDIALALNHTIEAVHTGEKRPCLCHGLPGNLSILRWYARRIGNLELLRHVEYGASRLLHIIRDKGFLYCDSAKVSDISFLTGMTGLGYFFLQSIKQDLPTVLALEVF